MDKRILAAVAVLGVLVLGGAGVAMMGGGSEPTEKPAPKKAKAKAKAKVDEAPDGAKRVRAGGADPRENDPTYHERAKMHRENREKANVAWREDTTAKAQEWLAKSGLDEATTIQVMTAFNKAHDTIAQSRADVEDGVIHPREGRDEQNWAKEDLRVELKNILGDEKSEQFLTAVASGKAGGF